MRKGPLSLLLLCVGMVAAFQSCRNDEHLTAPLPVANQSFTEEFDTVSSSLARGWQIINVSNPKGASIWQQGGNLIPWFAPYSSNGTYAGFIGADYESVLGGPGILSNWLVSPEIVMQNGDKISFYTRSWAIYDPNLLDTTDYGNSLQVRISSAGNSVNVGSADNVGDFTTPLLDINPNIAYSSTTAPDPKAYPTNWTRFEATVFGLNGPTKGRFAFRYYAPVAGLCDVCTGQGVGIDKVQYQSVSR